MPPLDGARNLIWRWVLQIFRSSGAEASSVFSSVLSAVALAKAEAFSEGGSFTGGGSVRAELGMRRRPRRARDCPTCLSEEERRIYAARRDRRRTNACAGGASVLGSGNTTKRGSQRSAGPRERDVPFRKWNAAFMRHAGTEDARMLARAAGRSRARRTLQFNSPHDLRPSTFFNFVVVLVFLVKNAFCLKRRVEFILLDPPRLPPLRFRSLVGVSRRNDLWTNC
jgi:hypothetical protein